MEYKKCDLIFYKTFFFRNISHTKNNSARYYQNIYTYIHAKYPLFLPGCNKTCISLQIFKRSLNIKFNAKPCSGSRGVPCGQTDGQTRRTLQLHETTCGQPSRFQDCIKYDKEAACDVTTSVFDWYCGKLCC
jgi:hypothetical protein